jgi:hypothetical protein
VLLVYERRKLAYEDYKMIRQAGLPSYFVYCHMCGGRKGRKEERMKSGIAIFVCCESFIHNNLLSSVAHP